VAVKELIVRVASNDIFLLTYVLSCCVPYCIYKLQVQTS